MVKLGAEDEQTAIAVARAELAAPGFAVTKQLLAVHEVDLANDLPRVVWVGATDDASSQGRTAISGSPSGNVWFGDTAGTIVQVSPTGVMTRFDLPRTTQPGSLIADAAGTFWFTETAEPRVGRFSL
jgi:hypothetical protein